MKIDEVAEKYGAKQWIIFSKLIFPNIVPDISTVVIYNFVHILNEFIFALILLQDKEKMTLPLGLQKFYGEFSVNVPDLMATLSLASLPLIMVFDFALEKVVQGLTIGSVKV